MRGDDSTDERTSEEGREGGVLTYNKVTVHWEYLKFEMQVIHLTFRTTLVTQSTGEHWSPPHDHTAFKELQGGDQQCERVLDVILQLVQEKKKFKLKKFQAWFLLDAYYLRILNPTNHQANMLSITDRHPPLLANPTGSPGSQEKKTRDRSEQHHPEASWDWGHGVL